MATDPSHWGLVRVNAAGEEALLDVVAVYGINGDRERSWTHHSGTSLFELLSSPEDLKDANIYTFGCSPSTKIGSAARDLVKSFDDERSSRANFDIPIVFVALKTGGLVVKQALAMLASYQIKSLTRILTNTRTLLFLGTPHRGLPGFGALRNLISMISMTSFNMDMAVPFPKRDAADIGGFRSTKQLVGPDLMTFVMGLANEEVIYVNSNFTDLGRASSREDPNYLRILFILQRASLSGGGRPTEEWQKRQMFRLDGAESETSKQWLVDLKADVHRVVDSRPVTRRSKIAILDTGIDWGHPAFRELVDAGRIIPKSFIEGLPADQDSSGHGTHAAHVLLQVAPNSKLFIARVIEDGSQAEFDRNISAIVEAIKWAVSQGVDIISMSFGYRVANAEIKAAIRDAFHKGVILLAAASNSGANPRFPISFPASMRQVICVHSSDGNGNPSTLNPPATPDCNFTILGEHVAAAWPRRLYTERTDNLRVASGTSIATPIAAGFAALILEYAAQNGPENEVVTRWMQLRHCDEMRKVFGALARERSGYRSIAPSSLFDYHGEEMHQRVSARINDILDSL